MTKDTEDRSSKALKFAGIYILYSLAFWFIFLNIISWGFLRIPMGLAGSLYPVMFLFPVAAFSFAYGFLVTHLKNEAHFFWTLILPIMIISIVLTVFCPMEYGGTYLEYFWHEILF